MIQLIYKTGYSFFYSALKCNDLVNISLESKSSYVAINDIRNMFGYLELEKLASKHHLTPLYLVEFTVLFMDSDLTFSLLCNNLKGYKNLCNLSKLISSFKLKKINLDELYSFLDGNTLILNSKSVNLDIIKKLENDNISFYIGLEVYNDLNKANEIRNIASSHAISIIPFNEVCILKKSDEELLKALEGISNEFYNL